MAGRTFHRTGIGSRRVVGGRAARETRNGEMGENARRTRAGFRSARRRCARKWRGERREETGNEDAAMDGAGSEWQAQSVCRRLFQK